MPVYAFVRLAKGVTLPDLIEVPLPTRFLFVLLGPSNEHLRYHEVGRSIATLMADEVDDCLAKWTDVIPNIDCFRFFMMLLIELAIGTICLQVF